MTTVRNIRNANKLRARGRRDEAVQVYKNILKRDANDPEGLFGLATIAIENENFDAARDLLLRALKASPRSAKIWTALAGVLTELNDVAGAERAAQKALELNPDFAPAYRQLGLAALVKGDAEAAAKFLDRSLKIDPALDTSILPLVSLHPLRPEDPVVVSMLERAKNHRLPPLRRSHLNFALARVFERAGAIDAFFRHLEEAHRLRNVLAGPGRANLEKDFAAITEVFTGEFRLTQSHSNLETHTPIFVVGLPRSGVALTGRILAAHSQIGNGPHLPFFRHYLRRATQARTRRNFPDGAAQLTLEDFEDVARAYQARAASFAGGKNFITDTAGGTFPALGMIWKALPWAKVVHVDRDPLDCGFSVFRNPPPRGAGFATDFEGYAQACAFHTKVMEFWRGLIPDFFIDVAYEDLVSSPEREIRRILDFCGLPWEDGVLRFHEVQRENRTVSFGQSHGPLNRDSIGSAAKYGDRLRPLRDALEKHGAL